LLLLNFYIQFIIFFSNPANTLQTQRFETAFHINVSTSRNLHVCVAWIYILIFTVDIFAPRKAVHPSWT